MPHAVKKTSDKAGTAPGTVTFVGERKVDRTTIEIIDFDDTHLEQKMVDSVEECYPFKEKSTVTWINIVGLHDTDLVQQLGEYFDIHPLILEDITHPGQRPKFEETDNMVFVVLRMLNRDDNSRIQSEQISIIFGKNYVITFQERHGDVFEPVRNRIKRTTRHRLKHPDYLAYALIDIIVDNYFAILEDLGETIETFEDEFIRHPTDEDLETIHDLKYRLIFVRKAIYPLREVVSNLERLESKLVRRETRIYLRDLYEHVISVIDTVETFREMASGLLDIYLSSVSNRMNQVMKVLTIIATIFIPLGFLAGVYGMNFNTEMSSFNMPELALKYGYIIFWCVALLIGGGLLAYFKSKKWI